MINGKTIKTALIASLMLIALLFAHATLAFAADPIGSGALHILGVGRTSSQGQQDDRLA